MFFVSGEIALKTELITWFFSAGCLIPNVSQNPPFSLMYIDRETFLQLAVLQFGFP